MKTWREHIKQDEDLRVQKRNWAIDIPADATRRLLGDYSRLIVIVNLTNRLSVFHCSINSPLVE